MSEPEEVIIDAAWHATVAARAVWRRYRPGRRDVELGEVRERIARFVTALYGGCPPIVAATAPAPRSWLYQLVNLRSRRAPPRMPIPSTDGARIKLPPRVVPTRGDDADLGLLRLLAVEMAARVARATHTRLPDEPLVRDLFLLAEAAAVDAALGRELPGMAPELAQERRRELAARPRADRLSPRERFVEERVRAVLGAPLDAPPLPLSAPEASLAWARRTAAEVDAAPGGYAGIAPVMLWGQVEPSPETPPPRILSSLAEPERADRRRVRSGALRRRPRARPSRPDEGDRRPGTFMVKAADGQQSVEDPMGLSRPIDRDPGADPDGLADSLSELPEATLVRSDTPAHEILASSDPPARGAARRSSSRGTGIAYPEWDHRRRCYQMPGAIVREPAAALGPGGWADGALARHAVLVREVRRRFERLRPRRVRIDRQLDGTGVDVDAFVQGWADRLAGCPFDDRVYETWRPLRRELAVCLLVNASASTDAWVSRRERVVNVEKEALLVVCEALEMLGDRYAIHAFSGEGPERVDVARLKGFDEPYGRTIRRRIAGLEPDRYTRVGAALRHASALLARQPARHRLLLLLSDGKPNDVDHYEGPHGVEDTRQAVIEARQQGLSPFCLAVDRHAPAYAPRLFGLASFSVLREPARLPRVLVEVLARLISR